MLSDIEIKGTIPNAWLPTMEQLAEGVVAHPWGVGPGRLAAERLIVTDDPYGAIVPLLTKEETAAIGSALQNLQAMVMGRAFKANDGRWTIVVRRFETEPEFLLFFAHELLECQIDAVQQANGHDHTLGVVAHPLWTEYVVERARKEIALSLQLPESDDYERKRAPVALERFLDFVIADIKSMPESGATADDVQLRAVQAWEHFLREWSGDAGRAAGGSPLALASQKEFRTFNYLEDWDETWDWLEESFREIYASPSDEACVHDDHCSPEVDGAYVEPLKTLFNIAVQLAAKQ